MVRHQGFDFAAGSSRPCCPGAVRLTIVDEQQIQEIADRVVQALNGLAPQGRPGWLDVLAVFGPYAALAAAFVAYRIGKGNLESQQKALGVQVENNTNTLNQKREADARAEWWKRTQWGLEAAMTGNADMRPVGLKMLAHLAQSPTANEEDLRMLTTAWQQSPAASDPAKSEETIGEAQSVAEQLPALLSLIQQGDARSAWSDAMSQWMDAGATAEQNEENQEKPTAEEDDDERP